uniref:Uncharacterized protein n=1 Tax=Rhizophora mucronata TaxID=61149 RepID=A0A2P2NQ19_RHIMU
MMESVIPILRIYQALSKMGLYPTSFIEQSKLIILGLESVEKFKGMILVMSDGTRLAKLSQWL